MLIEIFKNLSFNFTVSVLNKLKKQMQQLECLKLNWLSVISISLLSISIA